MYKISETNIKTKAGNLEQICDVLTNKNKGYHLKLSLDDNVLLFGDIDHHPEYKEFMDTSIYRNGWFRLPNQTNKDKPIDHKVSNGDMSDFIVTHIKDCELYPKNLLLIEKENTVVTKATKTKTIETKSEEIKLNDGKTKEEFIIKLLEIVDAERADEWEKWLNIGFILHTELSSEGFEIFDDFSKGRDKYNKAKFLKFWNSINDNSDNPQTIKSLMKNAKKDNEGDPNLYKSIIKEFIFDDTNKSEEQENYNKIKVEFELDNFKVINPIMFISVVPDNVYNTFNGYEVEKKEIIKNDIENSLIIKHIKNLCNNDDGVFDYVIKFLARKIQQRYKLTNTALIFKSNEGAGKDIFFNWFGNKILGFEYYINTEKPELLFGKFTSSLENKIMIVVNEVNGRDTFQINENIKCAITAEKNIIEHKGLKPYENNNHIGYIVLTNNDNPKNVPADDRSFCGIECNNKICNDKEYFTDLKKETDNEPSETKAELYRQESKEMGPTFKSQIPISTGFQPRQVLKKLNDSSLSIFNFLTNGNEAVSNFDDDDDDEFKDPLPEDIWEHYYDKQAERQVKVNSIQTEQPKLTTQSVSSGNILRQPKLTTQRVSSGNILRQPELTTQRVSSGNILRQPELTTQRVSSEQIVRQPQLTTEMLHEDIPSSTNISTFGSEENRMFLEDLQKRSASVLEKAQANTELMDEGRRIIARMLGSDSNVPPPPTTQTFHEDIPEEENISFQSQTPESTSLNTFRSVNELSTLTTNLKETLAKTLEKFGHTPKKEATAKENLGGEFEEEPKSESNIIQFDDYFTRYTRTPIKEKEEEEKEPIKEPIEKSVREPYEEEQIRETYNEENYKRLVEEYKKLYTIRGVDKIDKKLTDDQSLESFKKLYKLVTERNKIIRKFNEDNFNDLLQEYEETRYEDEYDTTITKGKPTLIKFIKLNKILKEEHQKDREKYQKESELQTV
eukprot:gene6002-12099_t